MADNNIKINRVNGVPIEDTELKNNVEIMNNELTAQIDQKASDIDLSIERNRIDNLVKIVESENGEVEIIIDPTTDNNVEIQDTFGKKIDDLKNEINVERNRINSISSLSEGSTTGDAELIDIRTGADGTTYSNAGTAVREQVKDLSSQIKEKANKSEIGSPLVANTVSEMTDTSKVYVYTGNEGGYINGNWYSYNGLNWISGGVYNSQGIADKSITQEKLSFDALEGLKSNNLFNKNEIENGYYIDMYNGNKYTLENWSAIEDIKIDASELNLVGNYTDYQGAFKDANKTYISGFDNNINPIPIPSNAVYLSISLANARVEDFMLSYGTSKKEYEEYGVFLDVNMIKDKSIPIEKLDIDLGNRIKLTVKQDGTGDFITINRAIESIIDSNEDNIYDAYIYEGEYDIFDNLTDAQSTKGITLPNFVNLIGAGRKEYTILKGYNTTDATQEQVELRSTLNIDYTNTLKNLTVKAKNCRYAVHADNSNTFEDYEWNIENCDFIHEGNDSKFTWQNIIAWGSGSASGCKEHFKNCRFKGNAGYTNHNNPNFVKDTYQEFENCTFEGQLGGMCVQFISMDSNVKNKVVMKGCRFNGNITLQNNGVNHYEFEITGYSNSPAIINTTEDVTPFFSDEINVSVANKSITKGQCVKGYYNQCEPLTNGGKENFFIGICLKDCVAGESCYAKYKGYIDLTGILDGLSVGDYIGIVNGVLSKVDGYTGAIGIIVNGNVMRFY